MLELLSVVCEGREATLEWLYARHNCTGNCRKLSDYAPDVERLLDASVADLRERARCPKAGGGNS